MSAASFHAATEHPRRCPKASGDRPGFTRLPNAWMRELTADVTAGCFADRTGGYAGVYPTRETCSSVIRRPAQGARTSSSHREDSGQSQSWSHAAPEGRLMRLTTSFVFPHPLPVLHVTIKGNCLATPLAANGTGVSQDAVRRCVHDTPHAGCHLPAAKSGTRVMRYTGQHIVVGDKMPRIQR